MKNPAFAKATADKIKEEILGKQYELSFAFVSKNKIKFLNKTYRKKDEPTDILSFSLGKNPSTGSGPSAGEILICKDIAKIKAKKFEMTFQDYLLFLVIHGMLHLKGLEHNAKMERYERIYHNRYRHRHL